MATRPSTVRTVREPVETTIRRLKVFVARMEHRYECPSDEMLRAVKAGDMRETAEVERWLMNYRSLLELQERCGDTTGFLTKSTK